MTAPLLAVRGVHLAFGGVRALRDVSLDVGEAEIHGLIGPNGSGKSSLLNVLTGFYRPQRGSVMFAGHDVLGSSPHRLVGIGLTRTFQGAQLFDGLTVEEHVMLGYHRSRRPSMLACVFGLPARTRADARMRAGARELLELVGLPGRGTDAATDLPYGSQRLLEIARALAAEPRMLLLDEPGAGMNRWERARLAEALVRVRSERGVGLVLVEHDLDMVIGISDRMTVLGGGTLLLTGAPAAVRVDPRFQASYLGTGAA